MYATRLESLVDVAVVGVTDYFTIEGYRKLLEYRAQGRLSNVGLLLANVEFRLDKIVGTSGGNRRLNYHVIFSEEVSAEEIDEHFLQELKFCFALRVIPSGRIFPGACDEPTWSC